jgi:peptidoglycan-binding protein ArfA
MPDTADVTEPSGSARRLGTRCKVAAVGVVVAVVAAVGWVVFGSSDEHRAPSSIAASAAPAPAQPELTSAPFSLTRDGNTVTLTGSLANTRSKSELAAAVKAQWLDATLDDKTAVVDGAGTPDMSVIGNVLSTADAIPDFGLSIDGATITLMGTAPNLDVAGEVQSAAALAFPGAKLANNIQIPAPGGPVAPPAQLPSQAPAPAPVSAPAPAAPAGGPCAKVQADVTELLRTPISFVTGGSQMTGESRRLLVQIADKIKGCPNGAVTVVGYTDNEGSDAVNLKLSDTRAKAVAAALVSNGVLAAKVTARGAGSANPVADNSTEEGRAKNRRVEITVG